VTVAVAVVAVLSPVMLGAGWLLGGAGTPLQRGDPSVLPAFVAAASQEPERVRTLVLEPTGGRLDYSVLRSDHPWLGDAELTSPAAWQQKLTDTVSRVASGSGATPASALAEFGIAYVLLPAPVDPDLEASLDSVPGLVRVANPGGASLWQVSVPVGRLRLIDPGGDPATAVSVLPAQDVTASAPVPATTGGVLALADHTAPGWRASADPGGSLTRSTYDDWATQFAAPAAPATVSLDYVDPLRPVLLFGQAVLWLALIVVALPGRHRDDLDDASEIDPDDPDDPDDTDDGTDAGADAGTGPGDRPTVVAVRT
jgi:hypothetical protein